MNIELASFGRAALFLGIPFVFMVFYLQWKWAKDCDHNIQLLIAQTAGSGKFKLAPKKGGTVEIKNPNTKTTRIWAINELATIDVTYPGLGFIPKFMQKSIRMAIVSEEDWEPLLNRSPHKRKVASPDMVEAFKLIAEGSDEATKAKIMSLLSDVSTSPTREMIASPAFLGNLMQEKISELAITISQDIINPLLEAVAKLKQQVSPAIVYIGLGLIILLQVFSVYRVAPMGEQVDKVTQELQVIKDSLGIKTIAPVQQAK